MLIHVYFLVPAHLHYCKINRYISNLILCSGCAYKSLHLQSTSYVQIISNFSLDKQAVCCKMYLLTFKTCTYMLYVKYKLHMLMFHHRQEAFWGWTKLSNCPRPSSHRAIAASTCWATSYGTEEVCCCTRATEAGGWGYCSIRDQQGVRQTSWWFNIWTAEKGNIVFECHVLKLILLIGTSG